MRMNENHNNFISVALFVIFFFTLMACNPLLSWAEPVITGTVNDSAKKTPLENVGIRIANSGFESKAGKNGQFKLPFVPGNFTVVFEGKGLIPKAVPLSLSSNSNYPMGEVNMYQFPIIIDMYENPLDGVAITVKQASYDSKGTLLSNAVSNSEGQVLMEYSKGDLQITAAKKGYRTRSIVFNTDRPQEVSKYRWLLPPDNPGLYYGTNRIKKSAFNFSGKKMVGFMIPAYYDGSYSVSSKPEILIYKDNLTLYWVPEHGATLGENPFASKGGIFIYKVAPDKKFVVYDHGRSKGERLDTLKITSLYNEVDSAFGGLVQQKLQVFKIELNLPFGQYVLFQGGGNSFAKEPHPEHELGCWHFKIVDNKSIAKSNVAYKGTLNPVDIIGKAKAGKVIELYQNIAVNEEKTGNIVYPVGYPIGKVITYLEEGECVDVLDVFANGTESKYTLKIRSNDGIIGYILYRRIVLTKFYGDKGAITSIYLSLPYEYEGNIESVDRDIRKFREFIDKYPKSSFVPEAILKIASLQMYTLQTSMPKENKRIKIEEIKTLYEKLFTEYKNPK